MSGVVRRIRGRLRRLAERPDSRPAVPLDAFAALPPRVVGPRSPQDQDHSKAEAGVFTVAPWHNSLGDIALRDGTMAALAGAGVAVRDLGDTSSAFDDEIVIVGGGDLLTPAPREPWHDTLLRYRVEGDHILNGVGLDVPSASSAKPFAYLRDYRLVTVRDQDAADFLGQVVDDVRVVPCLATLVPPLPWEMLVSLPGYTHLSALTPGEFVVVHRQPELVAAARALREPVVALDMQVWTNNPWTGGGIEIATHSPMIGMSIVAHAGYVFTRSLHLGIFALASGTPFAILDLGDRQARKCRAYMTRAGADASLATDQRALPQVAEAVAASVSAWSVAEHARCHAHVDDLVSAIRR